MSGWFESRSGTKTFKEAGLKRIQWGDQLKGNVRFVTKPSQRLVPI